MIARSIPVVLLLLAAVATPTVEPSANAGKVGQYVVGEPESGLKYWVFVPEGIAPETPAGIHLFFPGSFNPTDYNGFDDVFAAHRLIGITIVEPQTERDNGAKSAQCAAAAVAQVMADYPVVDRGIIASYDQGGRGHSLYAGQHMGRDWPFIYTTLYKSQYRMPVSGKVPMGFTVILNHAGYQKEGGSIRSNGIARMNEALQLASKGGFPDHFFRVQSRASITGDHVADGTRGYQRVDLALGSFLYLPHWDASREVAKLAATADAGQLGAAFQGIDQALAGEPEEAERAQLEQLRELVGERAERLLTLCSGLANIDGRLLMYYAGNSAKRLRGHPAADRLRAVMQEASGNPELGRHVQAWQRFAKIFPGLLAFDEPKLASDKFKTELDELSTVIGIESPLGRMCRQLGGLPVR